MPSTAFAAVCSACRVRALLVPVSSVHPGARTRALRVRVAAAVSRYPTWAPDVPIRGWGGQGGTIGEGARRRPRLATALLAICFLLLSPTPIQLRLSTLPAAIPCVFVSVCFAR